MSGMTMRVGRAGVGVGDGPGAGIDVVETGREEGVFVGATLMRVGDGTVGVMVGSKGAGVEGRAASREVT